MTNTATLPLDEESPTESPSDYLTSNKIPDTNPGSVTVESLPINQVQPTSDNPRELFEEADMEDLTASVAEHGVLEPIIVRPSDKPGMSPAYTIIAGERRYQAAKRAGLTHIPAIIKEGLDKRTALILTLVENLCRRDINGIEKAQGFRRLSQYGMSQDEIAAQFRLSQPNVANTMRLLKLPDVVQDSIKSGGLSQSHGMELLSVMEHGAQHVIELATLAKIDHWSLTRLRREIEDRFPKPKPAPVLMEVPLQVPRFVEPGPEPTPKDDWEYPAPDGGPTKGLLCVGDTILSSRKGSLYLVADQILSVDENGRTLSQASGSVFDIVAHVAGKAEVKKLLSGFHVMGGKIVSIQKFEIFSKEWLENSEKEHEEIRVVERAGTRTSLERVADEFDAEQEEQKQRERETPSNQPTEAAETDHASDNADEESGDTGTAPNDDSDVEDDARSDEIAHETSEIPADLSGSAASSPSNVSAPNAVAPMPKALTAQQTADNINAASKPSVSTPAPKATETAKPAVTATPPTLAAGFINALIRQEWFDWFQSQQLWPLNVVQQEIESLREQIVSGTPNEPVAPPSMGMVLASTSAIKLAEMNGSGNSVFTPLETELLNELFPNRETTTADMIVAVLLIKRLRQKNGELREGN